MFSNARKGESLGSKLFAVALSLALAAAFCPVYAGCLAYAASSAGGEGYSVSAASTYAGGNGTEESPYKISTAEQLAYMAAQINAGEDTSSYFTLTNDIDLSSVCSEALGSWTPIGTYSSNKCQFTGTFDGAGYNIENLYIADSSERYVGLFGYAGSDAVLKNFTLSGTIKGDFTMNVGAVCAMTNKAALKNIANNCTVDVNATYVGGFVGMASQAAFEQCANLASVSNAGGSTYIVGTGGIAGSAMSTTLANCYNVGSVTSTLSGGKAGGLMGSCSSSLTMTACYNAGKVSCSSTSYALCSLLNLSSPSIKGTYYLKSSADQAVSSSAADPEGVTSAESASDISTTALNAASGATDDVWVDGADGYPVFSWQKTDAPTIVTQPVSATYTVGDTAVALTVEAKLPAAGEQGADGSLSYQWYSNANDSVKDGVAIQDATSSSYTPTVASGFNTTYYYCVVTNTYMGEGSTQTTASSTSKTAAITTLSATSAALPVINAQPQSMEVEQTATANALSVIANVSGDGAGVLSYQWYKASSSTPIPASDEAIPDATESTYIPSTAATGEFLYYCVVTNTFEGVKTARTISLIATVKVVGVTISTVDDLQNLAAKVNTGTSYDGVQIDLAADLDLTGVTWTPIGTSNKPFSGYFKGNGHSIIGLTISATTQYVGLFGYVNGATIENLAMKNASVKTTTTSSSGAYAGIVAGQALNASFAGITVSGEVNAAAKYAGGVAGQATGANFTDCTSSGSVTGKAEVGGIVGELKYSSSFGEMSIARCVNNATVSDAATSASSYTGSAGGIAGYVYAGSSAVAVVKQCANKGAVTGKYGQAGGIAGGISYTTVIACYNTGTVTDARTNLSTTTNSNTGGITGYVSSGCSHAACYNAGTVAYTASVASCYNMGAVSGTPTASYYEPTNYYLDSSCAMGGSGKTRAYTTDAGNVSSLTAAELSNPGFVDTLNAIEGVESAYAAGLAINQNSPALTWELPAGAPSVETQVTDEWCLSGTDQSLIFKTALPAEGTGSDGTLSYQWYSSDTAEFDAAATPITDATSTEYKPSTVDTGIKYYWCIATNTFGDTSVSTPSAVAKVTVSDSEPAIPVLSVDGPHEVQMAKSGELSVSVSYAEGATGKGDLTYQWSAYFIDGQGEKSYIDIAEADKSTVAVDTTALRSIYYYCTVTNTYNGKAMTVDSGGFMVTVSPYTITSAEDLVDFATTVDNGTTFEGATVVLANDIDLSGVCGESQGNWNAIGNYSTSSSSARYFAGTFEGNGHTVSGLYANATASGQGLFAYLKGASIKELTVKGSVSTSTGYAGGIAAYVASGCNFINVGSEVVVTQLYNSTSTSYTNAVGGFVGCVGSGNAVFSGCYNKGKVSSGTGYVSGFVGCQNSSSTPAVFVSCYNAGAVSSASTSSSVNVGGFVCAYSSYAATAKFTNCYAAGKVSAPDTSYVSVFNSKASDFTADGAENGDNYYLDTAGAAVSSKMESSSYVKGSATSCKAAELKADAFLASIDAYKTGTWKAGSNINQTRPALAWETNKAVNDLADADIADVADQIYTGKALEPELSVEYAGDALTSGADYTVSYSANTEAGKASATITGTGMYSGTKTVEFNIVAPISGATIASIDNQVYTGQALEPKPVLTYEGATLAENTDYKLSYSDNVKAGTATVTITGMGKFSGETATTFSIDKKQVWATVEWAGYTYGQTAVAPIVKFYSDSSCAQELEETVSYNVKYSGTPNDGSKYGDETGFSADTPTLAGSYNAYIVVGDDNYCNPAGVEYAGCKTGVEVARANATVVVGTVEGKSYGDDPFSVPVVKDPGAVLSYASGNADVATVDSGGKITIIGVGDVTITVTSAQSANYLAGSGTATITVGQGSITPAITGVDDLVYNGAAQEAKATLDGMVQGDDLSAVFQYTDENGNVLNGAPVNAGKYTAKVVELKGADAEKYKLTGDGSKQFTIAKADAGIEIEPVQAKTYGDAPFTLSVKKATDAELAFASSNEKAATVDASGQVTILGPGVATITASTKATGNYKSGCATYAFDVAAKEATVEFSGTGEQVYDGAAHAVTAELAGIVDGDDVQPVIEYVDASGAELDAAPVDAGAYKATVAKLTGAAAAKYVLSGAAGCEFAIARAGAGIEIEPVGGKTLGDGAFILSVKKATDAELAFASSDEKVATVDADGKVTLAGAGEVTITASAAEAANFSAGEASVTFTVAQKPADPVPDSAAGGSGSAVTLAKVAKVKAKAKGKKKVKVTWAAAKDGRTGVQIRYSYKKNMKKAKTVTVKSAKAAKKVLKKLKRGKRVFIQVRAYKAANGQKAYGAWSAKAKVKVR